MKIIIKAQEIKVATGHRPQPTGTGPHRDKRLKRLNTRAAIRAAEFKNQ